MTLARISTLRLWDKNPREITKEKMDLLKKYIEKYGLLSPLKVTPDGEVLGGNHRLKAIKELGWDEVWIHEVNPKDDKEKLEIALLDNQEFATWMGEELKELVINTPELELSDFDVTLSTTSLADMFKDEKEVVEDEAPELDEQSEPVSKLGEVYQLGRHRLMCGDSTKIEDVEKLMDGKKADMVFTDPPYGIDLDTDFSTIKASHKGWGKEGGEYSKIIGDDEPFNYKLFEWIKCDEQFWWGANYYANTLPNLSTWFVWDKRTNDGENTNLDKRYGSSFEICWSKQKHKQDIIRKLWSGLFGTETQDVRSRIHPTQKPIEVCIWFIERFSKQNNIVLDLFGGSGSTLIACEQTNRTCYMMELDPKYCDVIRKRYNKFINNTEEGWQEATPAIQ